MWLHAVKTCRPSKYILIWIHILTFFKRIYSRRSFNFSQKGILTIDYQLITMIIHDNKKNKKTGTNIWQRYKYIQKNKTITFKTNNKTKNIRRDAEAIYIFRLLKGKSFWSWIMISQATPKYLLSSSKRNKNVN